MLAKTITVLLAGGVGTRLFPLTADRAKPAVPFAGKYRIIDFTLSNCEHSGLRRVFVFTQYKSHSLQKHLRDGWSIFNPTMGEYITPVPPQMRTGDSWYAGTADALYQNLYLLERSGAERVLVLSGDHVYRMDYRALLEFHCTLRSDATVACMRVPLEDASSFGVMATNEHERVVDFDEKPARPRGMPGEPRYALASMGIYVFDLPTLCQILREDHDRRESAHDFGKDILPRLIRTHTVSAYKFGGRAGRVSVDGYWRDVGTIDAYYEANMDLLRRNPPIDLYQPDWPIRTFAGFAPPARTIPGENGTQAQLVNSIICSGAVVSGSIVTHSILSPNVRVSETAEVTESILFNDVKVGRGARLKNCIVDKGVVIPPGETIGLDHVRDRERFTVSDSGIVVVPKGYQFPVSPAAPSTRHSSLRQIEPLLTDLNGGEV